MLSTGWDLGHPLAPPRAPLASASRVALPAPGVHTPRRGGAKPAGCGRSHNSPAGLSALCAPMTRFPSRCAEETSASGGSTEEFRKVYFRWQSSPPM